MSRYFTFGRFLTITAFLILLSGCKTTKVIEQVPVYIHDTTLSVKEVHDSTYIDRWHTEYQKGDTVFVADSHIYVTYRTRTDTAYKYVETPVEVTVEHIKEVEKPLTKWQQFRMSLGTIAIIAAAVCLLFLCFRLWQKIKKN